MCTTGVSLVSNTMYESNPLLVCANLEKLKLILKDNMLDNYVLAFFFCFCLVHKICTASFTGALPFCNIYSRSRKVAIIVLPFE